MRHSVGERWRFLVVQAKRLRDEATPEERMLLEQLQIKPGWMALDSTGFIGDGWYFQWAAQIRGPRGKLWDVIFDFMHLPTLLVVELDGRGHQAGHDGRRDRVCEFAGMKVLRFKNARIHRDLEAVVAEIHQAREEIERERN